MAEFQDAAERTEAPTPKRRRQARERGMVARSQELNSLMILTVGTIIVVGFHPHTIDGIRNVFVLVFNAPPAYVSPGNLTALGLMMLRSFFPIVAPFFIGIIAAAADIMGALASGTGILLMVSIIKQYYEQIAKEQLAGMGGEGVTGILGII